jgi:hypothetical protein
MIPLLILCVAIASIHLWSKRELVFCGLDVPIRSGKGFFICFTASDGGFDLSSSVSVHYFQTPLFRWGTNKSKLYPWHMLPKNGYYLNEDRGIFSTWGVSPSIHFTLVCPGWMVLALFMSGGALLELFILFVRRLRNWKAVGPAFGVVVTPVIGPKEPSLKPGQSQPQQVKPRVTKPSIFQG